MRTLFVIILTAVITGVVTHYVTHFLTMDWRDEKFAKLLWAQCPHLIVEPDHPERSSIHFVNEGTFVPVRPRTRPIGANPNN